MGAAVVQGPLFLEVAVCVRGRSATSLPFLKAECECVCLSEWVWQRDCERRETSPCLCSLKHRGFPAQGIPLRQPCHSRVLPRTGSGSWWVCGCVRGGLGPGEYGF